MDTKTKVAVCDVRPEFPENGWNNYYIKYHKKIGKMHKLDDGRILTFLPSLTIVDIRECIIEFKSLSAPKAYILNDKYYIEISDNNYVISYQL